MSADPFKIFICYAREDREALELLRRKLTPLAHSNSVEVWYDREITGGKEWDREIRGNLKTADVVLLLISDYFFESDYIKSVELREALDGHERQENVVVPVILHDCLWNHHHEIKKLQALPTDAKPVYADEHWKKPELGFNDVARGIVRILEDAETHNRRLRKQQRLQELALEEAADHARQKQERARAEAAEAKQQAEEATRRQGLPNMVSVKGGTFQMGSEDGKGGHAVTLSDFEIAKYPVTQQLWQDIMGTNPSHFKGDLLPVEQVNWHDCQEFLKKLNARFPGNNYRLPTEAEWEYAARGGEKGAKDHFIYAGSNDLDEVGWYDANSGSKTHPVGGKKPNQLGLYDMSGNVWEWCADWYGDYPSGPVSNPTGPAEGSVRVLRGGSWSLYAGNCRVSCRHYRGPGHRYGNYGFRVAASSQ
ncbi:MAG: SUMF1/EgtB/PvdO family nonheme iron enzyme [Saprospiraceae bacterium]